MNFPMNRFPGTISMQRKNDFLQTFVLQMPLIVWAALFLIGAAFPWSLSAAETSASAQTAVTADAADDSPKQTGVAAAPEMNFTLFLEISWLRDSIPRDALLVVPEQKVPMLLIRILDAEEKLKALAAAQVQLRAGEEEDILLECSNAQILWGKAEIKEVPEMILIRGEKGGVDLGGKFVPCLISPIDPNQDAQAVEKYLVPEEKSENVPGKE